jgi:hypothetical protein
VNAFGWLFAGICMAASRSLVLAGRHVAGKAGDATLLVAPPSIPYPNLMR